MNFLEFFTFKTIPCKNLSPHTSSSCFFYHENDQRRPLLELSYFLKSKKKKEYKLEEIGIYNKEITIEPELDKLIYVVSPCLNQTEHKYHVLNYKTEQCFFEANNIPCQYDRFCYYIHKNEQLLPEIEKFKAFYAEAGRNVSVRKSIINFWNNFISAEWKKEENKELSKNLYGEYHTIRNNVSFFENNYNNSQNILQINSENQIIKEENFLLNEPSSNNNQEKNRDSVEENSLKINQNIPTPTTKNNYERESTFSKDLHNKTIYKEIKKTHSIKIGQKILSSLPKDNDLIYLSDSGPIEEELKVIYALMNSHSGSIIYGVDKEQLTYKGFYMSRKERDFFKQEYNKRLRNYECYVKYKFFDMEDKHGRVVEDLCILLVKVKKVGESKSAFKISKKKIYSNKRYNADKYLSEDYYEFFKVKESFLRKLNEKDSLGERILSLNDIEQLKMRNFVEFMTKRLDSYYKNK